jgi:DNA repair exonuclease SbcCD ATPase subunit
MTEELKRELAQYAGQMERRKKISTMLEQLRTEQTNLRQQELELREILQKEEADVARLEKPSAASVFYSILGKKEEQRSKEQQEFYAARLKHSVAAQQLADCTGHIEALERERETLAGCEENYDRIFQKIQDLLRDDPRYAKQLCALEQALGETGSQLRELDEAIAAGNAAMEQVHCIQESLDSAAGWGTWDLLGGGLISDIAKHGHLDDAQSGVEELQRRLGRFRTELADVHMTAQMDMVNVDGFLRFADFFFDSLIADWAVMSHIEDSLESVSKVQEQLSLALSRLFDLRFARAADQAALEQQISQLVTDI